MDLLPSTVKEPFLLIVTNQGFGLALVDRRVSGWSLPGRHPLKEFAAARIALTGDLFLFGLHMVRRLAIPTDAAPGQPLNQEFRIHCNIDHPCDGRSFK